MISLFFVICVHSHKNIHLQYSEHTKLLHEINDKLLHKDIAQICINLQIIQQVLVLAEIKEKRIF